MRRVTLLGLTVLTAISGCVAVRPDDSVAAYRPGNSVTTTTAGFDATYALYAVDHPGATGPLLTVPLSRGNTIGFRREANRSVVAVAGERVIPIPDGACEWRVTPETMPGFWQRCGDEATSLGKGFVGTVGALLMAPFLFLLLPQGARLA